ncbi:MAG: glycosyltransferase family 2 protein [Spirochaetaceae bacterium]|nr:glycosyltransferase family 2 protein [Spirochaetaceae bacterium]
MLISVIVPVYNEKDNIRPLSEALDAVLVDKILGEGDTYEVIFVDDGSQDGSLDELRDICRNSGTISYLSFSRNFGQQAALRAGLEKSRGDCVIMMDGDFQHPPELLPSLVAEFRKGFDIVNTRRIEPARGAAGRSSFLKRRTSRLFYSLVNALGDVRIEPGSADFRLISRRACNMLLSMGQGSLFLRGAIPWLGLPTAEIPYTPVKRKSGTSKFTWGKMLALAEEGIAVPSLKPFRVISFLGMTSLSGALIFLVCRLCFLVFAGRPFDGYSIIVSLLLVIGGTLLVSIGFAGHYVFKIISLTGGRPSYIIKEASLEMGEKKAR